MKNLRLVLDIVGRLLWAGVAVIAALSLYAYASTVSTTVALSAPQQAALAGDSLVWVVAAYVAARAWSAVTRWQVKGGE